MNTKLYLVTLIFVFILLSCGNDKSYYELSTSFYKIENDLDTIINRIESRKNIDSSFLINFSNYKSDIDKAIPNLTNKLKSLGIKHLTLHKNVYPKGTHWYYFKTDWIKKNTICLIYNEYDSVKSKYDYYEKDEVNNETWGLGNNWSMFKLVKEKNF